MKITDSFRFGDFKKKFTTCNLQFATRSVRKRKIDGLLCYNSETLSLLSLCAMCCKLPSCCLPLKLLKNVHSGNNMFSPHCMALLSSCLTSWVRQQALRCACASSPSSSSVYRWITNHPQTDTFIIRHRNQSAVAWIFAGIAAVVTLM